jgi:cytidine deaminase
VHSLPLQEGDQELVDAATDIIRKRFERGRHHVAAAVRGESGAVYTGVNIEATAGRAAVCAEAVAIGRGLTVGEKGFLTIVGMMHPLEASDDSPQVWGGAPCGLCRELLADYMPDGFVLMPLGGQMHRVSVVDLLPLKYTAELT